MILSRTLLGLAGAIGTVSSYTLKDNFDKSNFFQEFQFFDAPDPTHGFVDYVNQKTAFDTGLAKVADNKIYLGADSTRQGNMGRGRPSTRVFSNKKYTGGLFVIDVQHMPTGCGVWPAIWSFGSNWPTKGEIDIIEGVHDAQFNAVALHTNAGCIMTNKGSVYEGSKPLEKGGDCGTPNGQGQEGCSQKTESGGSYGEAFNQAGGGFYVMEWHNQAISVWFFKRGTQPDFASPNPASWPKPMARFQGSCDIQKHFREHNIIINTTFCGDWAGNVWGAKGDAGSCAGKTRTDTCAAFVANNPQAFKEAYWSINSIKVFQK